jgi:multidrug resistance protein
MTKDKIAEMGIQSPNSSRPSSIEEVRDIEKVEDLGPKENDPRNAISSPASSIWESPVIPRHLRRGLLGHFALIPETTEPTHYDRRTKWMITAVVALAAAAAPTGSATILPALQQVSRYFHTSESITNLSMALYMLSMSIFPLWWSSFSETFGRRSIYIVSFTLYTIFSILSSISSSISMLIVTRLLAGGSAASVQAVGAGTIADIWEPKERGKAMGIFYLGPLCGPLFAPIIGGSLAQKFGWRATQWFLVIFGAVVTVGLVFLLPETLKRRKPLIDEVPEEEKGEIVTEVAIAGMELSAPDSVAADSSTRDMTTQLGRIATRQSVKDSTKKVAKFLKQALVDPLKIILLLRYPAVAVTVYYAAITFGSLYFLNISIETAFSNSPYRFSTLIVGLMYIPSSLGYFLASILGGRWLDHIMKREARKKGRVDAKGKLIFRPEDRMKENAWLACFLYPSAIIAFGWLVEYGVHWIFPVCFNP